MLVVDRFTKMAHFIGLGTNATAKDVAVTFLQEVWKLNGLPSEIIATWTQSFQEKFGNHCAKR